MCPLRPSLRGSSPAKSSPDATIRQAEVVREALRLLEERDQVKTAQLTEFNQELDRRLDALDRDERVEANEARSKLRRKSEARRNSGA
jgi:Arc/MetJ-type ribon-helix-helix transcriptional regulator